MNKIFGSRESYQQVRDLVTTNATPYANNHTLKPKPEELPKTSPFNYGQFAKK